MLEDFCSPTALLSAYRRVRANRGGPGVDNVTLEVFASELEHQIDALSSELLERRYKPRKLKSVWIAKRTGGQRELRIPSIRDRVAQTAMLMHLADELDGRMHVNSFAYRRGRGVMQALDRLHEFMTAESWVVDLDISKFFDSVDHNRMRDDLSHWVHDDDALALAFLWLKSFSRFGRGVAQGAPISPFLSNIFLHPVDRQLSAAGIDWVRYADDILIVAQNQKNAMKARSHLLKLLRRRGLSANSEKSAVLPPGACFEWLGARFNCDDDQVLAGQN